MISFVGGLVSLAVGLMMCWIGYHAQIMDTVYLLQSHCETAGAMWNTYVTHGVFGYWGLAIAVFTSRL
jgi:ABC-type antimicrobial peptide transport system permease subunit